MSDDIYASAFNWEFNLILISQKGKMLQAI